MAGGHDFFVMEACKSRLLGQGLLSCESMPIPAAGQKNLHSSSSNYAWHAGPGLKGIHALSLGFT
jgi:hypothetical protein